MALNPSLIVSLRGENAFGKLPSQQDYNNLRTGEGNSLQEGSGTWDPSFWFQDGSDRQGGVAESNPMAVGLLVGIAYSGLLLVGSLFNPSERSKLENDDMCGITTGGQARHFSKREF